MFGYVKIFKPELKIKDYEAYKGVYCTLCKTMGKKYGLWSRFTLSYDFTFFTVVRMAAKAECPGFAKSRCTFNPAKKCLKCTSGADEFEYTAAVAMIMLFYKIKDDIHDLPFVKKIPAYLLYPLAKRARHKAAALFPEADKTVGEMMKKQLAVEERKSDSVDMSAHPSAEAMSKLLSYGFEGENNNALSRIGYCIGRWVYIADAFDDAQDDEKSGSFNPFVIRYSPLTEESNKKLAENAENLMRQSADEAYRAFEQMKKGCFDSVIENILDCGLYNCEKEITERKEVKK